MTRLNFVRQGHGPTVVLSHALGCDLTMWDEVAAQLAPGFTVLRYDHCGHGKSEGVPQAYSIEAMADDAAALIGREVEGEVHFVGLSMGGMVAQQLAARHPNLVTSIVVANSSCRYDDTSRGMWRARIETVLNLGMGAISEVAMQRWFTRDFRADPHGAQRVAQVRANLERMNPKAYAACCEAVSGIDFALTNPRIACPALVIAGSRDEATPLSMAEAIRNTISGAEFAILDAAHLSAVEKPAQFANLVANFIRAL